MRIVTATVRFIFKDGDPDWQTIDGSPLPAESMGEALADLLTHEHAGIAPYESAIVRIDRVEEKSGDGAELELAERKAVLGSLEPPA